VFHSGRSRRGSTILIATLVATALMGGCGEDAETTTVTAGAQEAEASAPSAEEDTAAIEQLMVEYGAAIGADTCDYYSADFIAEIGSLERCQRNNADTVGVDYAVDDVSIDGDSASATVSTGGGKPQIYPLAREGESTEPYAGWTIDGYRKAAPGVEAETDAPDESAATPTTPATLAAAYQECIEAQGAQDVKAQGGEIGETVGFVTGGEELIAAFYPSLRKSIGAFRALKEAGVGYIRQLETAVLFSAATNPPAADLDFATDCVGEIVVNGNLEYRG